MPNILKRPMFRKGGSAAEGVGITSGLTERKQYADGPDINDILGTSPGGDAFGIKAMPTPKTEAEMLMDIRPGIYDPKLYQQSQRAMRPQDKDIAAQLGIMGAIEESMRPTGQDVMSDTLAAIASTAPDDPTKLQTFGQVLGKAGAAARGLEKKREETSQQFRKEAGLQILKNLTDDEKDQLFRYAKEYAKRTGMDEGAAYKLFLDRYLKGTPPKGLTKENLVAGYQKQLLEDPGLGYGAGDALVVARTQAEIFKGQAPVANPSPVKIYNGIAEAKDFKGYRTGEKFINPADGGIYTFDGFNEANTEAKFTKVWPTK